MSAELAVVAGIVAMAVLLGAAVWLWRRGVPSAGLQPAAREDPGPIDIDATEVLREDGIAPTQILVAEPVDEPTAFVAHAGPPRAGFDDDDEGTVFTARQPSTFGHDD